MNSKGERIIRSTADFGVGLDLDPVKYMEAMEKEMDENLQGVDTNSLLAEIERRKIKRPKMIHNFAYGSLQGVCEDHLDAISTGKDDSDFKNKIYKVAMEMWFGENVWGYINAMTNSDTWG